MTGDGLPDLSGQVVLVAGASRGIGAAIARTLARAGATVACAARTVEPGSGRLPGSAGEVAASITAAGGDAFAVACDVTDEGSVGEAVAATVQRGGRLDAAVCNAGVTWLASTLDTPTRRWELVVRVNLTGTFLVTRAALPHLFDAGGGSLVALTTTGVTMTELGSNAYWVAKAGVERYYAGLAHEVAGRGVAVACLAPAGVVLTEGWAAAGAGIEVPDDLVEPADLVARAAALLVARRPPATGGVHLSTDLVGPDGGAGGGRPAPRAAEPWT